MHRYHSVSATFGSKDRAKQIDSSRRSQQTLIENFEARDSGRHEATGLAMSPPKPTFHTNRYKYTRTTSLPQEPLPPQHEEIVRFLSDAWQEVQVEYQKCQQKGTIGGVVWYKEKFPNPQLAGFKPFDVDQWYLSKNRGKSK